MFKELNAARACALAILMCLPMFLCGAAENPPPEAVTQDAASSTAQGILDRMVQRYGECKSYHDKGSVETQYISDKDSHSEKLSFKTAFTRDPFVFRFEYDRDTSPVPFFGIKDRYIVHCGGEGAQTWWSIKPGVNKETSLDTAIAGATGVSSSTAHTIPRLLLPYTISVLLPYTISGTSLKQLKQVTRLEDAEQDSAPCFRIQGTLLMELPLTLWIDKQTYLLRRMDGQRKFPDFRTQETTIYIPEADASIAPEELEFNPPK